MGEGRGARGRSLCRLQERSGKMLWKQQSLLVLVLVVLVLVANVDHQHDKAREDAEGANDQVGDAQEGVLAAHPRDAAEDDAFVAAEGEHRVVVGDVDPVGAARQPRGVVALADARVQLAERGQRRRAHPHHEVLVDEAGVVGVGAELVDRPGPVGRARGAIEGQCQAAVHQRRVVELDVVVGPPGDAGAVERHLDVGPARPALVPQREGVVEEAVGDGAAGRDGQAGRAALVGGALVDRVAQRAGQPAELSVVAGHAVAPVVLVKVGELVVEVHGALEELGQREVPGARAVGRWRAVLFGGGAQRAVAGAKVAGIVVLELLDAVGGVVEAQAQADEGQARAEEERQRDAGRQQRLPGGEALLRERGVVGLVRAPGRGTPSHGGRAGTDALTDVGWLRWGQPGAPLLRRSESPGATLGSGFRGLSEFGPWPRPQPLTGESEFQFLRADQTPQFRLGAGIRAGFAPTGGSCAPPPEVSQEGVPFLTWRNQGSRFLSVGVGLDTSSSSSR